MQDEAFLCLKIMPHLPTQPKRQAVGTETHQGALLWEQELARQPVLSQPSLPVTHPVFEDVDFFFFFPPQEHNGKDQGGGREAAPQGILIYLCTVSDAEIQDESTPLRLPWLCPRHFLRQSWSSPSTYRCVLQDVTYFAYYLISKCAKVTGGHGYLIASCLSWLAVPKLLCPFEFYGEVFYILMLGLLSRPTNSECLGMGARQRHFF